MASNLESSAKRVILEAGHEVAGFYKKMRRDASNTSIVLEQMDNSLVMLSFVRGSNEEKIVHAALLCVRHDVKIRIKKLNDPNIPLQIQKFPKLKEYYPTKIISLKNQEEIIGLYKDLQKDAETQSINLVLQSPEETLIQVSFPIGSIEAEIIQSTFFKVKHNLKIGILKLNDPNMPIRIQKFYNDRTKKLSNYINTQNAEELEPYYLPNEGIAAAIPRVVEVIKNKHIIVAVLVGSRLQCNKMQNIGETNRFYCSHIGATFTREFCLKKCLVGTELNKTLGGKK
jgi:hypothetical protein